MNEQLAMNACQAGRCAELVDRTAIFCDRHDRMLHDDTRRELLDSWRRGKPPSKRFIRALGVAREEIRYAELAGSREPRPAGLPW